MVRTRKQLAIHVLLAALLLLSSSAAAEAQKGRSVVRRVNFPRGRTTTESPTRYALEVTIR